MQKKYFSNTGLNIGLLVQVRLESSRLKQKALLPLAGQPSIYRVMQSLSPLQEKLGHCALICPSTDLSTLKPIADEMQFEIFGGNAENLLQRYYDASQHFQLEHYIRATGDNPLTSAALAADLLHSHLADGNDFSAFKDLPLGSGVEIVRVKALEIAHAQASSDYDREHASPYLYNHPELFQVKYYDAEPVFCRPDIQCTMDTQEDYQWMSQVYDDLYRNNIIHLKEYIDYWDARK